MSAVLAEETLAPESALQAQDMDAGREGSKVLGDTVVELVRLAGGRLEMWAFEPAALLLVRAGVLDGTGLTFGSDYDLSVRSRELCRGLVDAAGRCQLSATSTELWLTPAAAEIDPPDAERAEIARAVFALPRAELERRARRQLLGE